MKTPFLFYGLVGRASRRAECSSGAVAVSALLVLPLASRAVDFHVATAQELQNALTLAAASSVSNNIFVTNGYYTGNFNYNSANVNELTILPEPGVANNQITIDSGGTGDSMSITASASPYVTVQGMTFLRNCGNNQLAGLTIAGGNTTILVNGCQFLSSSGTTGMGLWIPSGLNATVTNCMVAGNSSSSGAVGVLIGLTFQSSSTSGVPGNVTVGNCSIINNSGGLGVWASNGVTVSGSIIGSNSGGGFGAQAYGGGAYCRGSNVTLSGNTFTGNYNGVGNMFGGGGGGAYCNGTTITVADNAFIGNSEAIPEGEGTASGAGVWCQGGSVTLLTNTFTGNSLAEGYEGNLPLLGGGAFCVGNVIASGNTFTSNSAGVGPSSQGGGIYCSGPATFSGNTFTGNSSYTSGGGAFCATSSTFTGNTFAGNWSVNSGGGAYCSSSVTNTTVLSANIFQQNRAVSGGGLYVSGPNIQLLDNLVLNNSGTNTSSLGGGIWVDASSNLFMVNNTVTGNSSAGSGGGVAYIVTGTVELLNVYNNIIWGNTATVTGGDIYLSGTGKKKTLEFNDVNSTYGVWDIALDETNVAPEFFNPVGGDYHLQSSSPCLNAGMNGAPAQPLTDLDGNARTNSFGQIDLGCYEFNISATHPADTNASFVITTGEYTTYAAAWKAGQPWSNAPNSSPNPIPIPANYVTRAGYLANTNSGVYTNNGSARPTNWIP